MVDIISWKTVCVCVCVLCVSRRSATMSNAVLLTSVLTLYGLLLFVFSE